MIQSDKDAVVDTQEKAVYAAPKLVRIADIAGATEANTSPGGSDGPFGSS